jgi:hypothetical protein
MQRRTALTVAGVAAGAAALSTALVVPSYATAASHTASPTTTVSFVAPSHGADGTTFDIDAIRDSHLSALASWASALSAKASTLAADPTWSHRQRAHAKRALSAASFAKSALGRFAGNDALSLSATQQAKVAAIRSTLAGVVSTLAAALSAHPVVTATAHVPAAKDTVFTIGTDADADGRHHCDGDHDGARSWDGRRAGSWDGRRDGHRDGFRHH